MLQRYKKILYVFCTKETTFCKFGTIMAYLIKKATHAKQCVSFTKAVLSTCQSSAKKTKTAHFIGVFGV
jgi:hypothetical protein